MLKFIILFFILLITLLYSFELKKRNINSEYLIISSFIITIPFNITYTFFDFVNYNKADYSKQFLGQFGTSFAFETSLIFIILLLILGYKNFNAKIINSKNMWTYALIILLIISIINPYNPFNYSILVPIWCFLQLFLLFKLLISNFSKIQIFKGVFYGLFIVSIIEFVLVIAYPILNIEIVTTMFRGENALEFANRREGYASAIGTFNHPAHLGLFSSICMILYFTCYLSEFKKSISLIGFLLATFALFFTYSRTSFIVVFLGLIFIYVSFISKGRVFSMKNLILILFFFSIVWFIVLNTSLYILFFGSDSYEQVDNRYNHLIIGYLIFEESPFIGVGINSHVRYMNTILNQNLLSFMPILDFYTTNPIHNIHMIVLVETGLIGLTIWISFFINRIYSISKYQIIYRKLDKMLLLIFSGILVVFFLYGFFGWSPFTKEIFSLVIFFGALTLVNKKQSTKRKISIHK